MTVETRVPSLRLTGCSCHGGDDCSLGTAVVQMANSLITSMPIMGAMNSACHGAQITALCMTLESMLLQYSDQEKRDTILRESQEAARAYVEFCESVQRMDEVQGSA